MLVQLRRLVCLLVLLQCFLGACVVDATASETKKPIPCNDSEVQRDLERLKELKDYLPVLRDPEARAKEARVCLEIWGKAVDECKKNYGVIDSTLDLTKRIVFGHEGTKADVKWEQLNQTVSNCKSKEVQEFVRNYEGMMVKYNAAVKRTAELVEVARAKKVICDTYFDDLQHPFLRARESVWVFLPALNNETVQRCMPEDKGEEKRKTFLERYKAINDTYTQFFLLRGGTQVCRVNTGGSAGKLLNGTIALLKEKCKESPTIVSPTTAVKPPDEIDLRGT
ncbi:hypothetical protein LSM04_009451 [Trypanosoma melophagium]|uniref:uncharacterized protein n=1 Tax=Trypanosoma melophagium TaxID=715481 RepID=UPI00351A1E05|nr:hypothetical protein LSM04_009451 [Trypanosoma melophagium]